MEPAVGATLTIPTGFGKQPSGRYAWMTGSEDVIGDDWKDLAEKLKVELKDKDVRSAKIRVLVLNHLGAQGWELVSQSETTVQVSTFKRRLP